MYKIILLLILLAIAGCDKTEPVKSDAVKNFDIKGKEILSDAINIRKLIVAGNFLLAKLHKSDHFFSIYDPETLLELGKVVKKGNGPNEFPTSVLFDHVTDEDGTNIWVHDMNSEKYAKISLDKSLKDSTTIIVQKLELLPESDFYTAFYIDSTRIIGRPGNTIPNMNRLQIYNPQTEKIIKRVELFPKLEKKSNDLEFILHKYNLQYISHLGLKPDKTKIASAMNSFDRIDIFTIDGEVETSIIEESETSFQEINNYLNSDSQNEGQLKKYYSDIHTSDKFIYAYYYEQLNADYGIKLSPTQIRIFDWQGNKLSTITIPDYLLNFSIDEKRGVMYGVDYFNEKILKYDISHIINQLEY